MKLFVDDTKPAPRGWTLATTPEEAAAHLKTGAITSLSVDHDFTNSSQTGMDVLKAAQAMGYRGLQSIRVHSGNPTGAQAMKAYLRSTAPPHLRPAVPNPYTPGSKASY